MNPFKYPLKVAKFLLPQDMRDVILGTPLFLAVVFVGYSIFLDRNPSTPLTPTQLVSEEVVQGDYLRIQYHVQWNSNCRITGYRVIVDSSNKTHPFDPDTRLVMKGEDEFEISLRVPLDAFPGPAVYQGYVEYECNWLQRQFPLRRDLAPRAFTIISQGEEAIPASHRLCPDDKPVAVQAYCRALPVQL